MAGPTTNLPGGNAVPSSYAGKSGYCSVGSRFALASVNASAQTDTANQYTNSRLACPIYVSGSRLRICYALVAPNSATPVVCETATNGATIRCAVESPSGAIIQATPVMGPAGGSDNMSLVAAGGQLVWFEAYVPVTKGEVWWIRTFANKGTGNSASSLPNNINVTGYTTNPGLSVYDAWGDGYNNSSTDCTVGGTVTAVAGSSTTVTFGPCAVGVMPANPYSSACATIALIGDSTCRGQSDSSWRGGWAGREAIAKVRPLLNMACPGEASTCATLAQFALRNALMQMFGKYALVGYGWNDLIINGAGASSTAIANRLILAQWAVDAGCIPAPMSLWPAATSSDSWSSVANETVESFEAGRLAINADARNPGTPGVYALGAMDLESYTKATNGSGIVPGMVSPYSAVWGAGTVASVGSGTISPSGGNLTVNGVITALSGTDPQSPNYGNFAGGSNIVMTSGANNGTVYPVNGCNSSLFAVSGSTTGILAGDTFNLVYRLTGDGVHRPSRVQIALAALKPMHVALGL